jgi:hypothetical protein
VEGVEGVGAGGEEEKLSKDEVGEEKEGAGVIAGVGAGVVGA